MFGIKSLINTFRTRFALMDIKFQQFERVLNEVHCKIFQKPEKAIPVSDLIPPCSCEDKFESILEILREIQGDNDRTEENHPLNLIQDDLKTLLKDEKKVASVKLAEATKDKFDDYMKNVDKLNVIVNEIKGIAAMDRANLQGKRDDTLLNHAMERMDQMVEQLIFIENNMIDRFEFNKLVDKIKKTPLKKKTKI